nr:hypothetical protein RAR13_04210 [Aminobacter aminovorans]
MMVDNLNDRKIEDVPYSGLIESLSKITLICHTAGEAKDDLTKDDFMNFISQIAVIGTGLWPSPEQRARKSIR